MSKQLITVAIPCYPRAPGTLLTAMAMRHAIVQRSGLNKWPISLEMIRTRRPG